MNIVSFLFFQAGCSVMACAIYKAGDDKKKKKKMRCLIVNAGKQYIF